MFVTLTSDNEESFESVTLFFEKYSLVLLKMVFRGALRKGSSHYLVKNDLILCEIFLDEVAGSSEIIFYHLGNATSKWFTGQILTPRFESVFVTLTSDNGESFENVTLLFQKYSLVLLKIVFRGALRNGRSCCFEKNHLIL